MKTCQVIESLLQQSQLLSTLLLDTVSLLSLSFWSDSLFHQQLVLLHEILFSFSKQWHGPCQMSGLISSQTMPPGSGCIHTLISRLNANDAQTHTSVLTFSQILCLKIFTRISPWHPTPNRGPSIFSLLFCVCVSVSHFFIHLLTVVTVLGPKPYKDVALRKVWTFICSLL